MAADVGFGVVVICVSDVFIVGDGLRVGVRVGVTSTEVGEGTIDERRVEDGDATFVISPTEVQKPSYAKAREYASSESAVCA